MTSADQWLSSAPAHWTRGRLKDLISSSANGIWGSDPVENGNNVRCIRAADFDRVGRRAGLSNAPLRYVEPSSLRQHVLRPGDLVLEKSGGGEKQPVGMAALFTETDTAVCSNFCARIKPSADVDSRFLTYVFAAAYGQGVTQVAIKQTTGIQNLDTGAFFASRWAFPAKEEQRRIADYLDAETKRIDTLVAAKEQASSLIDERRIALISQHCLRGTNAQTDFKDSGIGPLGSIPAHWAIKRNKTFMCEVNDPSQHGSEELLTVSHLTGVTPRREKTVYMFQAESLVGYKKCRPGDLVINTLWAWMGALGVSRHEGIVSPAYGVYRFTSQDTLPEYFDLLFRTPEYVTEMTRYSKGVWTSRLRLYPESFLALSTPVPPLDEQEAIVTTVQRKIGPGRKLQDAIRRSNSLLAERRSALITAAVTGQFDVSTASGSNVTEGVSA
ncbi:restriction endonuclease subunit S [Streptomyces sp. NPDC056296]|uniref:restriction endonuclease subunit S n=1 Tax=Streptomyces sp. NPDC056296 TaxID=3345775 RepID=UPI0035DDCD28